jgi:sec-independent protein translocase protein TatA
MFPNLGPGEMMVVMIVAVILFGKRLPEVGRSLGKGIVEFKKGLRGMEDELHSSSDAPSKPSYTAHESDYSIPSVPKFEPPTSAPVPQAGYEPQAYKD